jgi:prepilin-type N-terminal cleavage/methylation domain-containing protein
MNIRTLLLAAAPALLRRRRAAGFTIVEVMVALALCGLTISVFYASMHESVATARSALDTTVAAELIQQRLESVRSLKPWAKVTTAAHVAPLFATASPVPADFPASNETITVAPYPADGSAFSVSRSATGAVTTTGASLAPTVQCVQVTMQYSWTQPNGLPMTRTLSTLRTKGGL